MSQTERKTTSLSLTIGSLVREELSNSKSSHGYSTLIQPLSLGTRRMQSLSEKQTETAYKAAPIFIKGLQNISATKGQLVVFECRIRASPTLQVHWYREYNQIMDSADFRILRKKACLSMVPEEVCTLVITEAFPEDSGIYECIAENELGAVASSALLTVSEETEKTEDFKASPFLAVTTMPTSSTPDRQCRVMGSEKKPSSVSPQNALDCADQEYARSWWQNSVEDSKDLSEVFENSLENSYHG